MIERLSVIRDADGRIIRIRYVLPRHKAANWVGPGRGRKSTWPGAIPWQGNPYDRDWFYSWGQVIDELGYVPTGKVGSELLFDVLSTAYERQSLIVTTNLPFEQWTEVLGSERLTGAALDRLTHRCHILEAKGESFRLRDARRRLRRASVPS